jgi:hypothetical protein
MKSKYIAFTFLIVQLAPAVLSQEGSNDPCINKVSTNHEEPYNNALPNDPNSQGYNDLFINHFNWIPFNQNSGNLGDLQTNGIPYLGANQFMFSLYDPDVNGSSTIQYYNYLKEEVTMPGQNGLGGFLPDHQNGWELLGVNLGFFPEGTSFQAFGETTKYPEVPYVILYNRYLSKIRVFANVGTEWGINNKYDAVRINLQLSEELPNKLNGLFRLHEGSDQTLDQPTDITMAGATAETPGSKQKWFSADFTVAYDPCVCYHPSAIIFSYELIKDDNLKLYGRGINIEEEIVDANGGVIENDFFANVAVDAVDTDNNSDGFVMYKKMDDLLQDYIDKMEEYESTLAAVSQHNETVERNLAIVKWVKHAVNVGVAAATGGSGLSVTLTNDLLQHASGIVGTNITSTELNDNWEIFFKEAEKIIGKEIATFVNESFKKKQPPEKPQKPTAVFSEMYFDGKIERRAFKSGHTMYTPGTYGNSITNNLPNQHYYPVYNEALGVFALLEKPKIEVSHTKETTKKQLYREHRVENRFFYALNEVTLENTIQLKLKDELKYTFNPVLNIESYDIQASIVSNGGIEWGGLDKEMLFHTKRNPDSLWYSNDPSPFANIDDFTKIITNSNKMINIESEYFNTDGVSNLKRTFAEGLRPIKYNTVSTPIDALATTVYSFGYNQEYRHADNFCGEIARGPICDDYVIYDNSNHNSNGNTYHLTTYEQYLTLAHLINCTGNPLAHIYPGHPSAWYDLNCAFNDNMFTEYENSIFNNRDEIEDELRNRALDYEIDKNEFYLKLLINVTYEGEKSDGSPHEYTYMFTYKIDPNDISIDFNTPIDPNLVAGSPGHINQYPQYLFLDGENFDGAAIEGCQLNGNTYLCKAIEEAELTGTFTVANGYNVIVEAGNEVRVLPEAITPPEMVWQIVPVWDFSNPMPPVDAEYVQGFCKEEGLYAANIPTKSIGDNSINIAPPSTGEPAQRSNFNYIIVPNPTTGDAYARVQLDEAASAALYITDLNGRKLGETTANNRLNKGQNSIQLPTAKLSKGIYLVHLIINNERHVKRLVKQ